MVQNVNPTFVKTPQWGAVQITTGTGSSTLVNIYTPVSSAGSKVTALMVTATLTTAAFDLQWGVSSASGGTFYNYGTVLVSAAAGSTDSVITINLLANGSIPLARDSDGNPYLFLPSTSYILQAKSPATSSLWTAGAVMQIIAPAIGDF